MSSTYYEVTLAAGVMTYRLGYSARPGRNGVLAFLRDERDGLSLWQRVARFHDIDLSGDVDFAFRGTGKVCRLYVGSIDLGFSGRTKLDAKAEGELPLWPGYSAQLSAVEPVGGA